MIKAFLFDYGGVITTGGGLMDSGPPTKLAAKLGISEDRAAELLFLLWDTYSAGGITEAAMWQDISRRYGHDIAADKWDVWNTAAEMQPLPEMVELVAELRGKDYTVGLLSNVIPNSRDRLQAQGWYDMFDFTILSCEVGYKKPDPEIYQAALSRLNGVEPNEVVFLDDQERLLAPAQALGMQTIHVTDSAAAIAAVHQLLA